MNSIIVSLFTIYSLFCVNSFDPAFVINYIETSWNNDMENTLSEFIKVPNQSPDFDPEWNTNGLQEEALGILVNWVNAQNVIGLQVEVIKDENRTPLIFVQVDANDASLQDTTVLMYGHFDKQPPLTDQWDPGLGPYTPVVKDGKLYGRAGADDGYSIMAAITSIKVAQEQNEPHPRCIIMIEGGEESGSPDMVYYLNKLLDRIGTPKIVMALDASAQDWDQLWMTVSLRGIVGLNLRCQLLSEGIHSGNSGLVRDSFHVLRLILSRIDNAETGEMLTELQVDIPETHINYAKEGANILGDKVWTKIPFFNDEGLPQIPQVIDYPSLLYELILENTWRPQLAIIGMDGMPNLSGGNVLRAFTTAKLSIRTAPSMDVNIAADIIQQECERKPTPWGANVIADITTVSKGFVTPEFEQWLVDSMQKASIEYFGKSAQFNGEGGTLPFMADLKEIFPQAQFIITGILGPNSNAHGPNEFLNIDFTKKIMASVAHILYDIGQNYMHETDICMLTKDKGPCMDDSKRYYYDETFGKCKSFIYGGCEGNGNNFKTKSDCNKACRYKK
eukprot:400373_1